MKKIKPTLSIGIPAHNEERNIKTLIESLLKQQGSFVVESIYVALDGCTDRTARIVKNLKKRDKRIVLIENKARKGKAARLNQIIKKNKSDYLAFFDADIVFARACEIDCMLNKIRSDKNIQVVAARQIPYTHTTFVGKIANASFNLWYQVTSHVNKGNHIHNLHGSASILKRSFTKHFRFPVGVISDQGYLYLSAIKFHPDGFALADDTQVVFRMVSTLKDARKQGTRSIFDDKKDMAKYFGMSVYKKYKIPFSIKVKFLTLYFLKHPLFTILAIFLGMYIRNFPYDKRYEQKGAWSSVGSTKLKIILY